MTETAPAARTERTPDELVGRLFTSTLGMMEVMAAYLGDQLGLYRGLHDGGPLTPAELASRAGIDVRYAREWLEQQAVTGMLDVEDPAAAPDERRADNMRQLGEEAGFASVERLDEPALDMLRFYRLTP